MRRQTEQREQRLGVEEVVQPDDVRRRRSRGPGAPTASWPPPGSLRRYWPNAGAPFATVGTSREPRHPAPPEHARREMLVAPVQPQRVRRHRHASRPRGAATRARRCRSARTRRRSGRAAPAASSSIGVAASASATSRGRERGAGALQRAVHRRDAWCRAARRPRWPASAAPRAGSAPRAAAAGRCWSAATNASRIVSRAAGELGRDRRRRASTRASGIGLHPRRLGQRRGRARLSAGDDGPEVHRPGARRCGRRSMSRQTLVAMR